jgi:mannose-6-phosphate isomerase-like protein (cupin superfamily)
VNEGVSRARLDPDSGDRFVALRQQLGVSTFGLNQMVLQPGERGRIHRHQHQEEVYLVLEGRLTLLIEGEETELAERELIRVAPDLRRQLVNRGPGRLTLIALGGATEHQGRDGEAFTTWEDQAGATPSEIPLPENLGPAERR